MAYYIAVDIGTSSCRAVLFTEELKEIAAASRENKLYSPLPGWAEQDPEEIWLAVVDCLKELMATANVNKEDVSAIGWSAVMHSLIAIDDQDQPLTKAWTWADLRSSRQADQLKASHGQNFYPKTGCPIHPMYWPAKLVYMREQMPEIWRKANRFVSIKEYLVFRMTGTWVADQSVASATGLLNIEKLAWDREILDSLEISPDKLSPPISPLADVGPIRHQLAAEIGLEPQTKVIVGASDGTLSNLGSGAVVPGVMAVMVGTSGALRMASDRPHLHPQASTWCYFLANQTWMAGGALNNGGNVLKWFRDHMEDGQISFDTLSAYAAEVPMGSRGLLFLPFLAGERCPHWNADARGVFFGLRLNHTKKDIARALMESVCLQMYSVYRALIDVTGEPREIRATGGLTKSSVWLQMMADVFGQELTVPQSAEGSAFGAAALAMIAIGDLEKLDDVYGLIPPDRVITPNSEAQDFYQGLYTQNRQLYWKLADFFPAYQRFLDKTWPQADQ